MPPLKATTLRKSTVNLSTENTAAKPVATRNTKVLSSAALKKENSISSFSKRKAVSPMKGNTLKRSALGNITNAIETQCVIASGKKNMKKPMVSTVTKPTISTTAKISVAAVKPEMARPALTTAAKISVAAVTALKPEVTKPMLPPLPKSRLVVPPTKPKPRVSVTGANLRTVAPAKPQPATAAVKQSPTAKRAPPKVIVKPRCMVSNVPNTRRSAGRRSTLDNSDGSLYMSALSDVLDDEPERLSITPVEKSEPLPKPLINIDEEYINDQFQCAIYAHDIFEYLKSREDFFKIDDYMDMQTSLGTHVRAIVVDWLVDIQENFELNHETLYLAVKLMDTYLSQVKVTKAALQLIAATSMFIAAKYDERMPPAIEDFTYAADGAYKRKDILKMEVNILRVVKFQLGFPLSYRFLRRYARCAKVPMPLLTLARYILEYTLMDYPTILLSDSKTAAAALYLAFRMKKEQEWDDTLIHFSGYRVKDFIDIVHKLNNFLHQKPRTALSTVRNKYSHQVFYEVAKVPLINTEDL